jgi:hypothetical protein
MKKMTYDTDLTDAAWDLVEPILPAARPGGRPRIPLPRIPPEGALPFRNYKRNRARPPSGYILLPQGSPGSSPFGASPARQSPFKLVAFTTGAMTASALVRWQG